MPLRVLSLNVWALPAPIGSDVAARMDRINAELPQLDADTVLYQEVWTDEARVKLIAGGRSAGYDHVWHREAANSGSGLLALSRTPFLDATFHRYTLCGLPQRFHHADYYSGKGFVQLTMTWDGIPVTLFATHMHARYAPPLEVDEYRGHRATEVIELARAVRAVSGPVVAVGDFNQREGAPEYQVLLGLTQLTDAAVDRDARQDTATLTNPYRLRRDAKYASRIDYVFTRPGVRHGARTVAIRRVLDGIFLMNGEQVTYSDHAGLLAEIAFDDRGVPSTEPAPHIVELAHALLEHGRASAQSRRTFERVAAAAGVLAATSAVHRGLQPALTRRRLLRAALFAGGVLATTTSAGLLALSERFVPDELAGYDAVSRVLDSIVGVRANARTDSPRRSLAWQPWVTRR